MFNVARSRMRRQAATATTRDRLTTFYLHSTPKSSRGLIPPRPLSEAFAR
jgi:hypothetical protein